MIPPCGVPVSVVLVVPSSTTPALSQRRMIVVKTGNLANNDACSILSKQPVMSASSIHSLVPRPLRFR